MQNNKHYNREGIHKVIAAVLSLMITTAVFLFCRRFSDMLYMTNDDTGIQNYLNGFTSGINDPNHQFISIFLGYPLAILYRLIPTIQWWFAYSQGLMLIGILLINYSMIFIGLGFLGAERLIGGNKQTSVCSRIFILVTTVVMFNIGIAIPSVASTSFTIVPALYGSGIMALFLLLDYQHRADIRARLAVLIMFLPVLFHRKQVGYVGLCFLLLVVIYGLVRNHSIKVASKKMMVYIVLAVTLVGTLSAANSGYKRALNGHEFTEFNKARSQFMDYPVDSYEDNPSLYEAVDWDRDTYVMASRWCFVDPRISAESLRKITESAGKGKESAAEILQSIIKNGKMKNLLYFVSAMMLAAGFVLILLADKVRIIFSFLNGLGSAVLIMYQVITGRLVYRSLAVVLIPAFVVATILLLEGVSDSHGSALMGMKNKGTKRAAVIIAFLMMIGALRWSTYSMRSFVKFEMSGDNRYSDADDAINKYIMSHANNFYVLQLFTKKNVNPRLLYKGDVSNSVFWGGSGRYCRNERIILEKNGIKDLNDETFLKDNVYLIVNEPYDANLRDEEKEEMEEENEVYAFCHWMSRIHPEYVMRKTDEICEGIYVYKFQRLNSTDKDSKD